MKVKEYNIYSSCLTSPCFCKVQVKNSVISSPRIQQSNKIQYRGKWLFTQEKQNEKNSESIRQLAEYSVNSYKMAKSSDNLRVRF